MGSIVQCFMLEKTKRIKRSLRRFCYYDIINGCPHRPYKYGSHDASVFMDEIDEPPGETLAIGDDHPHDDPLWPKQCSCGYVFKDTDQWQLFLDHLFKRSDTGEVMTIRQSPPGAMWDSPWMCPKYQGTDGRCLCVRTPGGDWMIDGPSRNADGSQGPPWTRVGVPPNISVTPSIIANDYHGFLTNGVLRSC